jgi:hypothetical protein
MRTSRPQAKPQHDRFAFAFERRHALPVNRRFVAANWRLPLMSGRSELAVTVRCNLGPITVRLGAVPGHKAVALRKRAFQRTSLHALPKTADWSADTLVRPDLVMRVRRTGVSALRQVFPLPGGQGLPPLQRVESAGDCGHDDFWLTFSIDSQLLVTKRRSATTLCACLSRR